VAGVDAKLLDLELITKAIYTSYESMKREGDDRGLAQIKDAEKNLFQALSFHLQGGNSKED
jgi:hypothetical protein